MLQQFLFSHLDKYKPCLPNGYPYYVSSWPEFVVVQINMTENYWLEELQTLQKEEKHETVRFLCNTIGWKLQIQTMHICTRTHLK